MSTFVHARFEQIASQFPAHIAVHTEEKNISYEELNGNANRLGYFLKELGLSPGMTVATFLSPGIELVTALLGILKAGGVYLPLSEAAHGKNMTSVLTFTDTRYLVIHASSKDKVKAMVKDLPGPLLVVIIYENESLWAFRWQDGKMHEVSVNNIENAGPLFGSIEPGDAAYIFFTSGSTGKPKAIVGNHKSLWHFIGWETKEFGIGEGHRVSQLSAVTFDASLRDFFLPLCNGGTLCIPSVDTRFTIPRLLQWIKQAGVTTIHCVPSVFRLFLKELEKNNSYSSCFANVQHILMAGESLYAKDVITWRKYGNDHTELVNMYGTTETTMVKTFHRIKEVPVNPEYTIHVGQPIDNAFVVILNSSNDLCQIGELGDVYILTRYMTNGYLKNEALNKLTFVPNSLPGAQGALMHRTGDVGRYLEDRNVEIAGRMDEQVKVNGIRVDMTEIKEHIVGYPDVDECLIVALKNEDNQTELIAYLVGEKISIDELREQLRSELPDYAIPGYFVLLNEFPLNINGKIDRKALPNPQAAIMAANEFEEAITPTERRVEAFWREVLGVKKIGKKAPFFKTGGNSLKAIQLISRIYKEMNVLVKIDELFKFNTIEMLASLIDNTKKEQYKEIPLIPEKAHYDLSASQKRMWMSSETEKEKAIYNIPNAYCFTGSLNTDALYRSLVTIVERHEILRTTFSLIEDAPQQTVHKNAASFFEWRVADISGHPNPVAEADKLVYQQSVKPFDLETGPLVYAYLLKIENNKHIFLLVMHHIISDVWSMDRFNFELVSLYNAYSNNRPSPLAPLRIQYKDYAAWNNAMMQAASYQDDKKFWHNQYSGTHSAQELPLDFPRASRTYFSSTIGFTPDAALMADLTRLVKNTDCSFFMLFLAILRASLFALWGLNDIIIGSPATSRAHPDLEDQIGFYVNVLLLRTAIDEGDSFPALLRKTKKNVLEVFEHQHYTFDQLVEDMSVPTDRTRNMLFDVGYTYVNLNALPVYKNHLSMEGVEVSKMNNGYDMVKTDIWCKVIELEQQLSVEVNYNKNLFRASTMEKFLFMIQHIIRLACQNTPHSLSEIIAVTNSHFTETGKKRQEQIRLHNLELLRRDEK